MTNEEILNGNKLIAEFMGYKLTYKDGVIVPIIHWTSEYMVEKSSWFDQWAKYDSDWNWLHNVIKKISEEDGLNLKGISLTEFYEKQDGVTKVAIDCAIKYVFNTCVEFITWYNSLIQQNEKQ